jgi:hypothetical protein
MPDRFEDVVSAFKNGPGPLIYHVHDEERGMAELPTFTMPAPLDAALAIHMRWFSGTIALPPGGEVQSVPDGGLCAEWAWPDGSFLLLMIGALPGNKLPRLESLSGWPTGTLGIRVNGRPMALMLHEPLPSGQCRAMVDGYLDERCPFWADVRASSREARDGLLAAVMTLEVRRTEDPPSDV